MKLVLFVFLSILSFVQAQPDNNMNNNPDNNNDFFTYLNTPVVEWTNYTSPENAGPAEGNGLYLSPRGDLLVATSFDATVRAFDPHTGHIVWTYQPNSLGYPMRCFGGVTFNMEAATPYLVVAIADKAQEKDETPSIAER